MSYACRWLLSRGKRSRKRGCSTAGVPCHICCTTCFLWTRTSYRGGGEFKRFFFRMTKIKGVKNWYCSLEMKEHFGMRPLAATS